VSGAPEAKTDNSPEVEVTPEMIEVGHDAFYASSSYAADLCDELGETGVRDLLIHVYQAMHKANLGP
jgi:hypothetical protein